MVYVSQSVQVMYLSLETMLNLGILAHNFPTLSEPDQPMKKHPAPNEPTRYEPPPVNAIRAVNGGCDEPSGSPDTPCSCPQRSVAPQRPSQLPFDCKPENNSRIKSWLLKRYALSTFNMCLHPALPCMDAPPCRDSHRPIGNTERVPHSGQDTTTLAGTCTPRSPARRGSRRDQVRTLRRACHVVSSHGHHSEI